MDIKKISYVNCSSLILSSILMISFYFRSKKVFLKQKGLSRARVTSKAIKEYSFAVHVKIYETFKGNIWWMIKCDLLKLSFLVEYAVKQDCVIKTGEMLSFLSLIIIQWLLD